MNDLVLRIRLEAMERNLRQVKALVDVVRKNTNSVRELYRLLDHPAAPAKVDLRRAEMAVSNIAKLLNYQDIADLVDAYGFATVVGDAEKSLANLNATHAKLKALVEDLLVNVKETDVLLSREPVRNLFGVGAADELLTETVKLQRDLRANKTTGGSAPIDPWVRYRELFGEHHQVDLFQEYVDVAAGLSLRGTGMDEHFCAMADWLSDQWTAGVNLPYWFAIPARHGPSAMTSIIRLGFPEWTIWALPLVAHEFGKILVDEDVEFRDQAADLAADVVQLESGSEPPPTPEAAALVHDAPSATVAREREVALRIRIYLADAFATYVMGPAYACACLLLRLDPANSAQPALDLVRATVVIKMLEKIDPGLQSHLSAIVGTLRTSWDAAVAAQLGTVEPSTHRQDLASSIVDRVVAVLELIEERTEIPIKFDDAAWDAATGQAEEYFGTLGDMTRAPLDGTAAKQLSIDFDGVTLPHVLNAAWHWRLEHLDSKMADAIAKRVREDIWPHLKPPVRGGTGSWKQPTGGIPPLPGR